MRGKYAQASTRAAVLQLIEQLRVQGKTSFTILLLGPELRQAMRVCIHSQLTFARHCPRVELSIRST